MIVTRARLAALLSIVTACGSAPSKPTAPTAPPPAPGPVATAPADVPPAANDPVLPLWPSVTHGTLPNGMQYYILSHHKPEKRAFLWLAVNAGSILEDDDQRGLAHFDEHMSFNGTKRFPKNDIIKYLESIGMQFGADLNAYTSFDETVYQLEVPTDKPEFVEKGLDILRDWAGDATYDPKEVDSERGVVGEEWRLGRGAQQRVFDKLAKVLFAGSRYADRLTIGLKDTIDKAPRDTLYRFYKDWYRPDLMAVIAVGDFSDTAALEKEIKSRFGDLKNPAHERPRIRGEVPPAKGTRVAIIADKELPGTLVQVLNLVPHRRETTEGDDRRLLVDLLYGQMMSDRLMVIARKTDAPFAFAQAASSSTTREIDEFGRIALVKEGRVEDTLRALFAEVLRVEKYGFTQTELDRAKANLLRSYSEAATQEATTDSRDYTSEIVRNFLEHELMIGRGAEADLAKRFMPGITLAELNKHAASFGGAENRVIGIASNDASKLPTEQRVLQIVDEVARGKVEPWEDKAPPEKLMAAPPTPGKILKEKKNAAVGITEWTLSNGAHVIVKPTDYETDAVSFEAFSPGGLAMASDKDFGNARFADDIVGVGGAGDLDIEQLNKALTGKQVHVQADIEETSEGLTGGASAKDLETLFQLVYLEMTAPRQDAQAIGVWRTNTAERLDEQLASPEARYGRAMSEAVFGKQIRREQPTSADVKAADADKAMAFYKNRFGDASDFTFVIVGAFDEGAVKQLAETYLASLPAKGRKEKEKDTGVRPKAGTLDQTWQFGTEPKAHVTLEFHGDETWSRDKDRDMFILGQVLSIRLRENLREDKGGVYGVGAYGSIARVGHQSRAFTISFGCDPTRVAELEKAAFDEIATLKKDGVPQDYLDKVKAEFLRARETQLRTNGFWLGWLVSSVRYGDDPAIILDPSKLVSRITSANVQAAAKRYLDPKQLYKLVMVPEGPAPAKAPAP
ncbi:MAG TPA: insulinase family protein [Kofleriaceae bacterium]|jgi:zinc protease